MIESSPNINGQVSSTASGRLKLLKDKSACVRNQPAVSSHAVDAYGTQLLVDMRDFHFFKLGIDLVNDAEQTHC